MWLTAMLHVKFTCSPSSENILSGCRRGTEAATAAQILHSPRHWATTRWRKRGKTDFLLFFLKKNPCCLFFLLFWSNCTEQVWGAVTSAPRIDAQEKLSKQRKKNDFFAQSNYTNMSENSQEKTPKNQIWDTRVSNNSLFPPQTFK